MANSRVQAWRQLKAIAPTTTMRFNTSTTRQLQAEIDRINAETEDVKDFIESPADKKTLAIPAQKFLTILPTLRFSDDYVLQLKYEEDGRTKYRNIVNINEIEELLTQIKEGVRVDSVDYQGSDTLAILDIYYLNENIELVWLKKDTNYVKNSGAYFKYFHRTKLDLRKYQIYTGNYHTDREKHSKVPCLIHTLEQCKVSDEKLNQLKLMTAIKDIQLSNMTKVAKELDIRINLQYYSATEERSYKKTYNAKAAKVCEIGLANDHYFINEMTQYTASCINHYHQVKDHKLFPRVIFKNQRAKPCTDTISSFKLITLLIQNKQLLIPITMGNCSSDSTEKLLEYDLLKAPRKACTCNVIEDWERQNIADGIGDDVEIAVGIEACSLLPEVYDNGPRPNLCICGKMKFNEYRRYGDYGEQSIFKGKFKELDPNDDYDLIFADFETFNNGKQHQDFCISSLNESTQIMSTHYGEEAGLQFLNSITKDSVIIFHNLGFDIRFLIKHLHSHQTPIETGNKMKHLQAKFGDYRLVFKDSYAFLNFPLKELPTMFDLESGPKDAYPYTLINAKNYDSMIPLKIALKHTTNPEQLKSNAESANCIRGLKLDIRKYTIHYCEQDVRILAQAYQKFRSQIKDITGLDIIKLISLPQMADLHLKRQGCYENIFKYSGVAQDFIRRCIVGGRVMCANNEKIHVKREIDDFDAVSLYPSAMHRLPGFLKGLPKVLSVKQENLFDKIKDQFDGYFIQIKVKDLKTKRSFPLQSVKEDGKRNFTNDLIGQDLYVDNIGLEDMIKFQGLKYEVIRGYYFDEGFNPKIRECILDMFNKRKELKAQKNNLQQAYKLILNSSYGKLIQKPINKTKKFFNGDHAEYFAKHYHDLIEYELITSDLLVATHQKSIVKHMTPCHLGVQILSMSKRIMNEVMCLAEDNNLPIFYQDTDSMHIASECVPVLSDLFKSKYNRELIGEDLGQFHTDFDAPGTNIRAVESIFLGKKSYLDKLEYTDYNGKTQNEYHIRMKGIPDKIIRDLGDPIETYKKLFECEKIEVDLASVCPLEMNKNYSVSNRKKFMRTIQF